MEAGKALCFFPCPTPSAVLYGAWALPPPSAERLPPCAPVPSCSGRAGWPATLPACLQMNDALLAFPATAGRHWLAQDPAAGKHVRAALLWGIMQRLKYVCLLHGFRRAAQAFPYFLGLFNFFFFLWILSFHVCDLKYPAAGPTLIPCLPSSPLPPNAVLPGHSKVRNWADWLNCSAVWIHTQAAFGVLLIWCDSKISQRLKSGQTLGRSGSAALHCPITPMCVAGFLSSHLRDGVVHPSSFLLVHIQRSSPSRAVFLSVLKEESQGRMSQ